MPNRAGRYPKEVSERLRLQFDQIFIHSYIESVTFRNNAELVHLPSAGSDPQERQFARLVSSALPTANEKEKEKEPKEKRSEEGRENRIHERSYERESS